MDAVTYPEKEVVDFVVKNLIPVRIDINDTSFYEKYQLIWTPTTLVLDYYGKETQRSVGFFTPADFIVQLQLGIAKVRFSLEEFDAAEVILGELASSSSPSDVTPEAIYFRGVNLYKRDNDPTQLKKAWEILTEQYPDSIWTKRAAPYRLI
ncbi:MAG: hypothetical protein V2J11_01560 [Desulfofustis sp.]|jgi:hypothetical protein|nr:hypothetical protein [Desulfofustis sp.]